MKAGAVRSEMPCIRPRPSRSAAQRICCRMAPPLPTPHCVAPATEAPNRRSPDLRSEEHTSELQSLMRISYAVFCLKKKKHNTKEPQKIHTKHNKQIKQTHQSVQ